MRTLGFQRRLRTIMRLIDLLDMCRDGRRYMPSLPALAKQLGCHARTVRRDLVALEACGIDVPKWRVFPEREAA